MKSKIISLVIILNIITGIFVPFTASAYEIPNAFWDLNDSFDAAWESQNYTDAAYYGSRITDLFLNEPENETTIGILGSRSYNTAISYFFTGDYENAVRYFEIYIPYGKKNGWSDGVKIAENVIKQASPRLELYEETDTEQVHFGIKDEPHGILYGEVSDKMKADESMVLLYLSYSRKEEFDWAEHILDRASKENKSVELALNFVSENADLQTICHKGLGDYTDGLYKILSKYKNIPLYLRIGAEMNIWMTSTTPDYYITAFRKIADKFHSLPNVATVWSVGHTSRWQTDDWPYITDDFYPGDEYVDWVGVSAYMNKYFNGERLEGINKFNEVYFKTGYSADPVIMIEDVVNTYGNRKPIMVAEGGSAYRTNGSVNETDEDWAVGHFEQMYYFIPMVYPQVKLMAYFNKNMSYEYNYYDLTGCKGLQSRFDEITKNGTFIKDSYSNKSDKFYRHIENSVTMPDEGSLTLTTYPHIFGADKTTVIYYLDGEFIHSTSTIPYSLKLTDVKSGSHKLRVIAEGSNGSKYERTYTVNGSEQEGLPFSDIESLTDAQKEALGYMFSKGIINGYEDGTVRPQNSVTRAEFATMVSRLMGYETDTPCTFDDAFSHWSTNYIEACVKAGAINGVGDNKFEPESNITFEQAVKITTIVTGKADSTYSYPDGFITAALNNNMLANMTNTVIETPLSRIDTIVLMYNGVK